MPTFVPPTADTVSPVLADPHPGNALFRHYKRRACGRSVLKESGVYTTVDNPPADRVNAADVAYIGGHRYEVTAAEATALTNAGYGAYLS